MHFSYRPSYKGYGMTTDAPGELDELLDALAEYAGDSKDKQREVALKILDRDGVKPIGQILLQKGIGKRTGEVAGKAAELESQVKELKDAIAERDEQIRELQSSEPNWQRRIQENDRKWQQKLDVAEAKVTEERHSSLNDKVGIERQKFVGALRIGQEGGVDEDFGQLLPAKYADRFVPDPESRTVRILELGESKSFYDPADGEPAEQLARDVIAKLPPKARIMGNPEGGGGTQGGTGTIDKATRQIVDQKARTENYTL